MFAGACQSNPQEPQRPRSVPEPIVDAPARGNAPTYSHSESIRIGVAGGYLASSASVERDSPIALDPELADDYGWGGFVEIVADDVLHLRCFGARADHEVLGTSTSARVRQAALLAMASFENAITEDVTLAPLFGLGIGYTDADFDPLLGIGDRSGASLLAAAAVEAEIAGHAFLGAMLTAGLFGDPGDTEGTTGSVMFYAGVRF